MRVVIFHTGCSVRVSRKRHTTRCAAKVKTNEVTRPFNHSFAPPAAPRPPPAAVAH